MAKKEFQRPDEAALLRILQRNEGTISEMILRFAWTMGLSMDEMNALKWEEVSFEESQINLPDRSVPMDEDMKKCLQHRYSNPRCKRCEYVMTTDTRWTHMHPVYISKYAHQALEEEATLRGITLKDLRTDYVIRLLEQYDWPYAARLSGMAISSLYSNYSQYMKLKKETAPAKESVADDYTIWNLMQAEGASPVGLALWMSREMGVTLTEIATLTWEQVDMEEKLLHLEKRDVPMGTRLERLLKQVKEKRDVDSDSHVLLTPHAKGPYDPRRLGVVVKQALIRAGMEGVSAADLICDNNQKKQDTPILDLASKNGGITRNDAVEQLGMTKAQANGSLVRLVEQGKLVRVGLKYFRPGMVVPPEKQYDVICAYLTQKGRASRQELAMALQLEPRSCGWILNRFVEKGLLTRTDKTYSLPDGEKTEY